MAPRTRVVSNSSTVSASSSGSVSSPSRPPSESRIEVAYNTAVQSFVRRDHVKTQAAISRLLELLITEFPQSGDRVQQWRWDEIRDDGDNEGYEWKIKVLKLAISVYASLYSDPSNHNTTELQSEIKGILPPTPPDRALEHVLRICQSTLHPTNLLPPQLISTLILASLKLKPSKPALDFAHRVTEIWLSDIPDDFIRLILAPTQVSQQTNTVTRKRIESTREAYLKVVELFVGEVLTREGEYEMARAFLDGDDVLGSKRKENLYRHLRTMESRFAKSSTGSSPSNSGILPAESPSASLILPTESDTSRPHSRTGDGNHHHPRNRNGDPHRTQNRSRSSSTSSSSSERTARPRSAGPNGVTGSSLTIPSRRIAGSTDKGKEKEMETETGSIDTNSTLPVGKKIYINPSHSGSGPSRRNPHTTNGKSVSRVQRNISSILDLIPLSIKKRITSPAFILSTILPIPLVLILMVVWIKRRRARLFTLAAGAATSAVTSTGLDAGSGAGPGVMTSLTGSTITAEAVRKRLETVRQRGGWRAWVAYWIRWWIKKFVGVIKMGTTISYI